MASTELSQTSESYFFCFSGHSLFSVAWTRRTFLFFVTVVWFEFVYLYCPSLCLGALHVFGYMDIPRATKRGRSFATRGLGEDTTWLRPDFGVMKR